MSDQPENQNEISIADHTVVAEDGRRRAYDEEGICMLDLPAGASDEVFRITLRALQREREQGVRIGRAAVQREFRVLIGAAWQDDLKGLSEQVDSHETGLRTLMKRGS